MQKRLRLRQRQDFLRLRQAGQKEHHAICTLGYLPNGYSHNRYGFIVSRRMGNAVQRNRIRRMLREIVRLRNTCIKTGYDIVIIAKLRITTASFDEMSEAVETLLICAGLWMGESEA